MLADSLFKYVCGWLNRTVSISDCMYLRLYNVECHNYLNDLERMQKEEIVT